MFDAADKVAAEEQDGNGAQPNQAVGELGDGWAVVPGKQAPSVYATAVFGQAGVKPPAPPPAPPTRAQLIEQRLRAFMLETRKRIDALGLGTTATSHAVMSLPAGFSMPAGASVPGSGVLSSDEQGGDGASAKTNGRTSDAGQAPQADGAAGEDGTRNAGASVGGDKASQVVPPAGVAGGDGAGATDSKYLGGNWDDADGYYNVQIGEVLHSRYKVTERVGRGVFSFVVRAIDMNAEPDQRGRKPVVCIKIVRRNDMMTRAAVKEVRILSELAAADPENRRRCIRLLAHFTFRRHSCMVFESMEMDLRKLIRRVGRGRGLSLEAVRSFGQQLFVALKLVHQVGYVHADLKPDNIVVDKRRAKIKLCDFGSAIPTRELPDYHETAYIQSRYYRAPEVAMGLTRGPPMDVWSAACVMFELFASRILFCGADNRGMIQAFIEVLGPVPTKVQKRARFTANFFNDRRQFISTTTHRPLTQVEKGQDLRSLLLRAAAFGGLEAKTPASGRPRSRTHSGGQDEGQAAKRAAKRLSAEERAEVLKLHDLLRRCLSYDPAKRLTAATALQHAFFKKQPGSDKKARRK